MRSPIKKWSGRWHPRPDVVCRSWLQEIFRLTRETRDHRQWSIGLVSCHHRIMMYCNHLSPISTIMTAHWKPALVFGLLYSTVRAVVRSQVGLDLNRFYQSSFWLFFGSSMMPTRIRFPHQPKKWYSGLTNSIFNKNVELPDLLWQVPWNIYPARSEMYLKATKSLVHCVNCSKMFQLGRTIFKHDKVKIVKLSLLDWGGREVGPSQG